MEDYNSPYSLRLRTEWETQLREVIWSLDDGQPRFKSEHWQTAFLDRTSESLFQLPLESKTWKMDKWIGATELENRIFTYCMLLNASTEKRERYRKRIRCILNDGMDIGKGQLYMHSSTVAAWTRKT